MRAHTQKDFTPNTEASNDWDDAEISDAESDDDPFAAELAALKADELARRK